MTYTHRFSVVFPLHSGLGERYNAEQKEEDHDWRLLPPPLTHFSSYVRTRTYTRRTRFLQPRPSIKIKADGGTDPVYAFLPHGVRPSVFLALPHSLDRAQTDRGAAIARTVIRKRRDFGGRLFRKEWNPILTLTNGGQITRVSQRIPALKYVHGQRVLKSMLPRKNPRRKCASLDLVQLNIQAGGVDFAIEIGICCWEKVKLQQALIIHSLLALN